MAIKVFKFGGASVKNADSVKNVAGIVSKHCTSPILAVVSAMGKTTNALETLINAYTSNTNVSEIVNDLQKFHLDIAGGLFSKNHPCFSDLQNEFDALNIKLNETPGDNYDFEYDQLVSLGEVWSTKIVAHYLKEVGINIIWQDARRLIRTDSTWREGRIDWEKTEKKIAENTTPLLDTPGKVVIVQGFLGGTDEKFTTTLGREGSDFTAAIFAYCLNAESVTIWKDVPGVLNADPKWFDNTVKLDKLSFREAIELTYYGATIIHPRTIKPLENKNIPLFARSFVQPDDAGTMISKDDSEDSRLPSFIFKVNQVLISITPRDFSFVMEDHLSQIFSVFSQAGVRIHLMQNSALNFSVCVDYDDRKFPVLIKTLKSEYQVKYNMPLELVTIRHWDEATITRVTAGKEILVDQRTRITARMVMRDKQ
jgi:aspartate kinase